MGGFIVFLAHRQMLSVQLSHCQTHCTYVEGAMHGHCVCCCAIGLHLAVNLCFTTGHEVVAHGFYIKPAQAPIQQPSVSVSINSRLGRLAGGCLVMSRMHCVPDPSSGCSCGRACSLQPCLRRLAILPRYHKNSPGHVA